MSQLECKACGFKFNAVEDRHYVARDNGKTGLTVAFGSTSEESLYDAFDCPMCGCQVIAKERKRNYIPYVVEEDKPTNNTSNGIPNEVVEATEEVIENTGMSREVFQKLLDELDGNSLQTLKEKNAKYSSDGDCLHNFRSGGDIFGGTPAQACWGYLTKHLVALRDMVERNDFHDNADFLEKCQDSINYIRFLWCIGNDEKRRCTTDGDISKSEKGDN